MPPKRPIRNVFDDDEDDASASNGAPNGTPPKKPRPDSSRPAIHSLGVAPPITQATGSQNGRSTGGENSIQAQVAAAKARAQALMSAMQNKGAVPNATSARPLPATAPLAAAAAAAAGSSTSRFAPVTASGSNGRPTAAPTMGSTNTAARPPAGGGSTIQAQLEAARARVQAQMAALNNKARPPPPPSATLNSTSRPPSQPTTSNVSSHNATTSTPSSSSSTSKAPTGIHPLLLSSSLPFKPSDSSTASTSTSYVKGKASSTIESNPYLLASQTLTTDEEKPKARSMHKGFQFHKPGRHVKEAEELRREQQMEELKKRIEQSARKAGLQDELAEEKRLLKRPPPEIEWWDENLLDAGTYDQVPDTLSADQMLTSPPQGVLLFGSSSPIDGYVQHPIPIPSPSDSNPVQPRGLMLTKREQRKLRRQRRAAAQQDKRDRIKMGLLPPEPPKVKLSNLMRVLTSEAVSDPTKIEARVRREIAARAEAHERHNADRKLTPDQRREKLELKKTRDEELGLACQVYKVKHLISGRHKFKVKRNALDHALTGVVVFGEKMALIVVEGSEKALKKYKRLMMVRIDWTDPGPEQEEDQDEKDEQSQSVFQTLTTGKDHVDWETNTCELIFEGPIRERNWKAFRARPADTDQAARDALGEQLQGYWDVAKRATQSSTDAF